MKWETKKHEETHFQRASPLCAQREMPPHEDQLGFGPAGQLLCTACQWWQDVQTEPSPQFPETQHNWKWIGAALAIGQRRN